MHMVRGLKLVTFELVSFVVVDEVLGVELLDYDQQIFGTIA